MSTSTAQPAGHQGRLEPLKLPQRRAVLGARRLCSTPTCEQVARRRGRRCNACSLRAWREAHRDADRAREVKRAFTEEQRLLRNARATVAMAIKRGKLKPQACQICQQTGLPYHPDPEQKLHVLWLCKPHRNKQAIIDREARRTEEERDAAAARKSMWDELRTRFTARWPLLPPHDQQAVQSIAHRDPLIRALHHEAPLARQALIRAYGVWSDNG